MNNKEILASLNPFMNQVYFYNCESCAGQLTQDCVLIPL